MEYIPNFKYEIYDISHLKDEDIKGTILNQIAFLTMKYVFKNEINDELPKILKLYKKISSEKKSEHLDILLQYIISSAKKTYRRNIKQIIRRTKRRRY